MQFTILFVVSCLMQMRRVADKSLPMNGCIPFSKITYFALFVVQLLHSIGATSAPNVVTSFQSKNPYILLFFSVNHFASPEFSNISSPMSFVMMKHTLPEPISSEIVLFAVLTFIFCGSIYGSCPWLLVPCICCLINCSLNCMHTVVFQIIYCLFLCFCVVFNVSY